MLKKYFLLLVIAVMAVTAANASTWKYHSSYVKSKVQNIFDTGDKVYYLNSNKLFRFDKETSATIALNKQNVLSDNRISEIYYDWERKLLFIAYVNANIDVIDDAGKVTNISSIKNMVFEVRNYTLNTSEDHANELVSYTGKEIRDITFGGGKAFVAAGYGYFVINEETFNVEKSYDLGYNICINSAGLMGEKFLIFSNNRCYYGEPENEDPVKNYKSVTGTYSNSKMYPINDHSVFVFGTTNGLYRMDFSSGTPTLTKLLGSRVTNVQKTPTGFIANLAGTAACYSIDASGTTATKISSVITCASAYPSGDGTVWITDADGLHIMGSTEYYKMNSLTFDEPYWLKYNAAMDKLYVGNSAPNMVTANDMYAANHINTYDGVNWADATAYTATGAGYEFVINPLDPHTYMRSSWNLGVFKVTDDVRIASYTYLNSGVGKYKPHPAFDKYGNMWVVSSYVVGSDTVADRAIVLPKDKVAKKTFTRSDWFRPKGLNLNTGAFQRSRFIVASKNNLKIYSDCDFLQFAVKGHLVCWDNGNEDPTVDNYRFVSVAHFVDQFNRQINWTYLAHFEEDKSGLIWVGHTRGLFVFDPDVVFDNYPRAVRPYIEKSSEGMGYLCDGLSVYDIGVDRENNKWIACDDGLYYVSPDGSEVFNHFTVENSDIPSNTVYSVECDTVNDRVYIFTSDGFAEYVPHGDAATIDFDDVCVYPNPVEPDFTGMIKITKLMEGSFVTVTDSNGNVVAQLGPVMGSAYWDGCDATGERVPTGIYNIYAAQGSQPALGGAPHATVMIIK